MTANAKGIPQRHCIHTDGGPLFFQKSEQDCLRYLDGHLDAATLVREVLRQPQDTAAQR